MVTLYQRTDCPFCWKVRLALAELSLEYRTVETKLGEKHPDLQRLSPTGGVPVMVEGDVVVWESAVILDYLDRRYAPGCLIPTDPAAEARVRSLQVYSDKLVGSCLFRLVSEKRSKLERDWDRELIEKSETAWRSCQAWLEPYLDGRDFFGAGFSAADCALASRCGVGEAYGAAVSADFPNLHRWYRAVKTRPAWEAAYPTSFIRT